MKFATQNLPLLNLLNKLQGFQRPFSRLAEPKLGVVFFCLLVLSFSSSADRSLDTPTKSTENILSKTTLQLWQYNYALVCMYQIFTFITSRGG